MDDRQMGFNALKAAVDEVGILDIVDIEAVFETLPPADVRQVVRCGDCKCFDIAKNGVNGFCTKLGIPFDVYDYCSLGEPRENGNLELQ